MQTTRSLSEGIHDIYSLPEPVASTGDIIVISLLAILLLMVATYFATRYFLSARAKAKKQVQQLANDYFHRRITLRQLAFHIAEQLQYGLKIQRIDLKTPLPQSLVTEKQQWDEYVNTLTTLRYCKNTNKTDINILISRTLYWLQAWPK